ADGGELARPAGANQVADGIGRLRVPGQAVLGQPVVIKELAEIITTRIRAEHDDQVVGTEPAGELKGRRDGRAARTAYQDPFSARQRPCRVERFGVADANPLVHDLAVQGP